MMETKQPIISLEDVSFSYNQSHEQLAHINLQIAAGEVVLITGPSGGGKTTLTRLLNGLIPHFYEGQLTGDLTLMGRPTTALVSWEYAQLVGSVFQDSKTQFFSTIVEDELAFSGENFGIPAEIIREKIAELAKEANLTKLLRRSVMAISSGEKQKVALASARITDPELFVLDEPSANLDMVATADLAKQLKDLKQQGKTIIIAEHRLYYLLPFADRILYLANGQLQGEWLPAEVSGFSAAKLRELGLRKPDLSMIDSHYATQVRTNQQAKVEKIVLQQLVIGHKGKKQNVLQELSFSINKGEIVALTGPNGIGKTTLAQTLSGLLKTKSGELLIDGEPLSPKKRLKKIWFVMQDSDYQLFADSVLQELVMTTKRQAADLQQAEKILKSLALWDYRDHHPASLSGGQKQRLTFAVGMMQQPEIIILDEPTSGLDGKNLQRVIGLLKELAQAEVTILVITHDYELVAAVCQRLLYFNQQTLLMDTAIDSSTLSDVKGIMEKMPD